MGKIGDRSSVDEEKEIQLPSEDSTRLASEDKEWVRRDEVRREWAQMTRPSTSDVGTSLSLTWVVLMHTYMYPSCLCTSPNVAARRHAHLSVPLLTNHSYSFPACLLINLLEPVDTRPIWQARTPCLILWPLVCWLDLTVDFVYVLVLLVLRASFYLRLILAHTCVIAIM